MKRDSKAAKIRSLVRAGKSAAEIAKELEVPVSYVYNEKWKMKKAARGRRINIRIRGQQASTQPTKKSDASSELQTYIDDLAGIRRQIENFQTIEAFLRIRIQQMEQNAKWTAKAE